MAARATEEVALASDIIEGVLTVMPPPALSASAAERAVATGRWGEEFVARSLRAQAAAVGGACPWAVEWVNEVGEVGLPYDIKLVSAGEDEIRETYIEVKATVEERTDGGGAHFFISREELAAAEREGEAYHIYFVTAAASPHAALVRIVDPAQKWEEKQVKMCMFA